MQAPVIQIFQEQFKRAVIDQNIDALRACLSPPSEDTESLDMNALCFKMSVGQVNALMYVSSAGHLEVV